MPKKKKVPVKSYKAAQTCPGILKDGKTKTSASQIYTSVTAACLTNHVRDDITVPGIPLGKLKRSLHAPLWVTTLYKWSALHTGSFC